MNEIRKLSDLLLHSRLLAYGRKAEQEQGKHYTSKEIEESRKLFQKLYEENKGKIPNTFPKSVFDKNE